MIFTSFEFVLFFLVVLLGRGLLRSFAAEKWFLLVASYLFYMSWSIPFAFLILFTSLVDYGVGAGLGRIEDQRRRKLLLVVSIVANLGVLGFFKYTNFLLQNVDWAASTLGFHVQRLHYDILLPVGISFFTFQSMTYTIETYRRNIPPSHSPRDFLVVRRLLSRSCWPARSIALRTCSRSLRDGFVPMRPNSSRAWPNLLWVPSRSSSFPIKSRPTSI